MLRALIALGLCATAICGVKGAPRPAAPAPLAGQEPDAGGAIPSGAVAPDATAVDPAYDPLGLDAGCADGGK